MGIEVTLEDYFAADSVVVICSELIASLARF